MVVSTRLHWRTVAAVWGARLFPLVPGWSLSIQECAWALLRDQGNLLLYMIYKFKSGIQAFQWSKQLARKLARQLLQKIKKKITRHIWLFLFSLSHLKSSENGNGVTFRSGDDVNMDIGVTGFGPESAIDRSLAMVSVVTKWLFEGYHFYCFIKEILKENIFIYLFGCIES